MIKKSLSLVLPIALSIILSGCGDSTTKDDKKDDSSSQQKSTKIGTATFNALSSGVTYKCGSEEGALSESGIFKYEAGEGCTFFDGTTPIKTVVSADLKQGVEINEEKTQEVDTASKTAILQDLLMGKTYYSVEPKNTKLYKLQFASNLDQEGALWVTAFRGTTNETLGSTTSHVIGNTLSVSMISLNITFIEENKDGEYLLFDSERRMYLSKDKAEAFVATNK